MSGYDLLTKNREALRNTRDILLILCHEPLRPYVWALYPPAYLPLNKVYEALYPFYEQYFASGNDYVHFPQRDEHLKQAIETLLATLREQMDERDIDRLCTWISKHYISEELDYSLFMLLEFLRRDAADRLQARVSPLAIEKIQNLVKNKANRASTVDRELDEILEAYKAANLPQTTADGEPLFTEGLPFYDQAITEISLRASTIEDCILFKQLRDELTSAEFAALCAVIMQDPAWQKGSTPRPGHYTLVPLERILDQFYVWFP